MVRNENLGGDHSTFYLQKLSEMKPGSLQPDLLPTGGKLLLFLSFFLPASVARGNWEGDQVGVGYGYNMSL